MKERETRTRSTLGLMGFLLVLVTALGAQAEPPSSTLPDRKPDSKEPWDAFLGKVAHEEEVEQRGELAEQAIRAAYGGGERPSEVPGD